MLVEADLKDPVGQRGGRVGEESESFQVCETHYRMNLLLCPKLQSQPGDEADSSSHFLETPTGLEPAPFHGCVFDVLASFDWLSFHCKNHQAVALRSSALDEKVPTRSAEPSDITGRSGEPPAAPVRHRCCVLK